LFAKNCAFFLRRFDIKKGGFEKETAAEIIPRKLLKLAG